MARKTTSKPEATKADEAKAAEQEVTDTGAAEAIKALEAEKADLVQQVKATAQDLTVANGKLKQAETLISEQQVKIAALETELEKAKASAPPAMKTSPQVADGAGRETGGDVAATAPAPAHSTPGEHFIRVTGPREGRRRSGRRFNQEPVTIDLSELDQAEAKAICDDAKLSHAFLTADDLNAE